MSPPTAIPIGKPNVVTSDFNATTLPDELEELDTLELTELDELLVALLEELFDALLELPLEIGGLLDPPPPPQAVNKTRLARSMPVCPQVIRRNIIHTSLIVIIIGQQQIYIDTEAVKTEFRFHIDSDIVALANKYQKRHAGLNKLVLSRAASLFGSH